MHKEPLHFAPNTKSEKQLKELTDRFQQLARQKKCMWTKSCLQVKTRPFTQEKKLVCHEINK